MAACTSAHDIFRPDQRGTRPAAAWAFLNPSSPSTSTHHPSNRPLSPPIAAPGNVSMANLNISSSYVPGCSQTARTPAVAASCSRFLVTAGGVMMLRLVCAGSSSWLTDARVGQSCPLMLTLFARGLIGVGSMPWQRYHAKTIGRDFRQWSKSS